MNMLKTKTLDHNRKRLQTSEIIPQVRKIFYFVW
jgi:hypothetical protein